MTTSIASPPLTPLLGSVLVLIQFDVCEELRLDQLQQAVDARTVQQPKVKHSVPAYVRYQRPPVVGPLDPLILPGGERLPGVPSDRTTSMGWSLEGEIKYYDYGVVSVIYQLAFSGDWQSLVHLASRWVWDVDFAARVEPIVRQRLARNASAMIKPYSRWLSEDYFIFHVRADDSAQSAADLTRDHGLEIAQIVRGDRQRLSPGECAEVLQSRISYYDNDLAVIGWNAAFLYDTSAGAESAIQLLEYANSQLLEFRHYDELLTGILNNVYHSLEQKKVFPARWRMGRRATRLHTVLLDIAELTERADNSIKFLSDMFAARLYRLAAVKVGVPDYKDLVAQKLKTAEDLYHDMIEQFNQARGFFLEFIVVLILLIELFYLFRGKVV
ncbi:conserved hypothetical protein [Candidatus Sulfotelmatomonas gaucii]|uniref:DUF155 domain-containing protein n=1 Tax=Candidatus Sulfuritelmatomonas gaucii TaxID=2043161 RepID=A0A2N9L650_9BACT|nr:conserved hypothetical protein [Candidatus Sulfotelmatomonas gaucii]